MSNVEQKLRSRIESATQELNQYYETYFKAQSAIEKQRKVVNNLKAELKAYPAALYWSRLSTLPLPLEIIYMITDQHDIASRLYTAHPPSMKLMIRPSTLAVLHVKFCLGSAGLMPRHRVIKQWLALNQTSGYTLAPRWKKYHWASSLNEMSAMFTTLRFSAGPVTLTFRGDDALLAWKVPDPHAVLAAVQHLEWCKLELDDAGTGVVIKYKPLPDYLEVRYGGRPTRRRLVVCRR